MNCAQKRSKQAVGLCSVLGVFLPLFVSTWKGRTCGAFQVGWSYANISASGMSKGDKRQILGY